MKTYAYIFVERNMGQDYAFAEPPLGCFRGLLWRHSIYPEVKTALENRVQAMKEVFATEPGRFKAMLSEGISVHTFCHWHTVYSVRITPDSFCPDSRAKGRSPHFTMHLLMPGAPEVISKRFTEFRSRCQEIAWRTMQAGARDELKVIMPDDLYV